MVDENVAGTEGQAAASGAETTGNSGVPKELEKFKGADGKLDLTKLSQGYLESEKKATTESQRRAEAERAYNMALTGMGGAVGASGAGGGDGRGSDTGYNAAEESEPVTQSSARPVVQTLLVLAHPELAIDEGTGQPKDPKFYDGLLTYMKGLPLAIRERVKNGDFQMTEWAVREYKALSKTRSSSSAGGGVGGSQPNFVEGASPSGGSSGGKTYSRSEVRRLMLQNPEEYARLSEDYGKAVSEGRVKA